MIYPISHDFTRIIPFWKNSFSRYDQNHREHKSRYKTKHGTCSNVGLVLELKYMYFSRHRRRYNTIWMIKEKKNTYRN